jgi:hypothetical protein
MSIIQFITISINLKLENKLIYLFEKQNKLEEKKKYFMSVSQIKKGNNKFNDNYNLEKTNVKLIKVIKKPIKENINLIKNDNIIIIF